MGFYGNITNINKTTFQFDKIYPNRKKMDDACAGDGVFIGRYALVDYDKELSLEEILLLVNNNKEDAINTLRSLTSTEARIVYGWLGVKESTRDGEVVTDPMIDDETGGFILFASRDETKPYQIISNDLQPSGTRLRVGDFVFIKGQVVEREITEEIDGSPQIEIVYEGFDFDSKSKYELYLATENDANQYLFVKVTDDLVDELIPNQYLINYRIDQDAYPHSGRGYDSTVWQKTYKTREIDGRMVNEQAYVSVAELNSVVPTLDIDVDAPTSTPLKPHWDTDSSNVYYKLHVQPSWGLRVHNGIEDKDWDKPWLPEDQKEYSEYSWDDNKYPSDIMGDYFYGAEFIMQPDREDLINHHIIKEYKENSPLAIYFNKAGFNRFVESEPKWKNSDMIQLLPSGTSMNQYYVSHDGTKYGYSPDTYELSMMLPSLGSSISDIWNIIYGPGTYKDSNGNYLWDKTSQQFAREPDSISGDPGLKVRNTAIEWNTTEGRRAVKQIGNSLTYDMENLNTVAGIINSVHDLMGMIIRTDSSVNNVKRWDTNKIYFVPDNPSDAGKYNVPGKYYYKQKTYTYSAIGENNSGYYPVADVINLLPFSRNENGTRIIGGYYKKSEEQYDSYKDFYETETSTDERITYNYNNFYKVNNDKDIDINAVYGMVTMEQADDLDAENYVIVEDEDELNNDEVYFKKIVTNGDTGVQSAEYWKAKEQRPQSTVYYRIDWQKVQNRYYYLRNKYYIGVKHFQTAEEKELWENGHANNIKVSDYDYIDLCSESTIEMVLLSKSINPETDFYRFYLGVVIDPSSSVSILVDQNAKSVTIPLSEFTAVLPEADLNEVHGYYSVQQTDGTTKYFYRTEKLCLDTTGENEDYLVEELQKATLQPGAQIAVNFKASIYINELDESDTPVARTLAEWDATEEEELSLVIKRKLVPEYTSVAYSISGAIEIAPENIKDLETGGLTSLYFISDYYSAHQTDPRLVYCQETYDGLQSPAGQERLREQKYYELNITETLVYYRLDGEYYFEDEDGNWIRETAQMLRSDTDVSKYYKLVDWQPLATGKVPFKSNTYYKYENGAFSLIPSYSSSIDRYWTVKDRYVMQDTNHNLEIGSIWNPNADTPNPSTTGITLGYRNETYEARELVDFAKYINTIHGLILEINKKLLDGDALTRDTDTVQGAINRLNDIINNFYEMIPGEVLMTDALGRVHSGEITTDNWIEVTTGAGTAANDFKPSLYIQHQFTRGSDTNSTSNLNIDNVASDKDSDKLQLYTPILDDMGHVVAKNIETVTLPYGFKTISIGAGSNAVTNLAHAAADLVAENTQDTLTINPGNKWMKLAGTANNDSFSIGHLVQTIDTADSTATNLNNNSTDIINIPDFAYDEAGHLTAKKTHNYTLPYNFKTITVGDESDSQSVLAHGSGSVIADQVYDTVTFNEGNMWISLAADAENDTISIGHAAGLTASTVGDSIDQTPKFGDTFQALRVGRDIAGHVTTLSAHTVELPTPSLAVAVNPQTQNPQVGNIVTELNLVADEGAFTYNKDYVGNLALTGYTQATNSIASMPQATDSINDAISKLSFVLNNDKTTIDDRLNNLGNKTLASSGVSIMPVSGANTTQITRTFAQWAQLAEDLKYQLTDIYQSVSFAAWPIGSIYLAVDDIDPVTKFGVGTWVKIGEGQFLMSAGENFEVNSTGGSSKISVEQLPAHTHTAGKYDNSGIINQNVAAGNNYTAIIANGNEATTRITTNATGNGDDYYPPYIAVSMWKRTA